MDVLYKPVIDMLIFVRAGGEDSERYFCDQKQLNWQILRMTCEAKNQLRDILVNAGFPEESLAPQGFNFRGPDLNLDVVGLHELPHN